MTAKVAKKIREVRKERTNHSFRTVRLAARGASLDGSVEAEGILLLLDQAGICASSGSACSSGSIDPSHVLMAMGCGAALARSSVRFSLGIYNTEAEVDYMLQQVPSIIAKLRATSKS